MISYVRGNLLEADAEALVNTVNTVGVMGKGIALQFRQAFPQVYDIYRKTCDRKEMKPGKVLLVATGRLVNPRYVINFPTKRHWKENSRLEDIEIGLTDLVQVVKENQILSIAIPPLGCGNGVLDWGIVRPLIENAFAELPDIQVFIYEPNGAPAAKAMPVATARPNMTLARAAVIKLMELYRGPGYALTKLELQKLAYFLQNAGMNLRLNFVKQQYGPYAENLNHALQHMEGHFIRGYGDRTRTTQINLLPGAAENAEAYLLDKPEAAEQIQRVAQLIEGFETPYGMELLATIHWLTAENPAIKDDIEAVAHDLFEWNEHKRKTFQQQHIAIAWHHLHELDWF